MKIVQLSLSVNLCEDGGLLIACFYYGEGMRLVNRQDAVKQAENLMSTLNQSKSDPVLQMLENGLSENIDYINNISQMACMIYTHNVKSIDEAKAVRAAMNIIDLSKTTKSETA